MRVAVSSPTVRSFLCRVYGVQRTLSAEELSRDVERLAANDNDLLALEELLSNGRGKTTEKVALAIDGDLLCAVSFHPLCHSFPSIYRYSDVAVFVSGSIANADIGWDGVR